jgi:hypothetical protein
VENLAVNVLILADYEGLSAGYGQLFGMFAMAPGLLLGIGGIVAGTLRKPWRNTAMALGSVGFLLGFAGLAFGLFGCWEERNHVNYRGEHFWPSPVFVLSAIVTLGVTAWTVWIGKSARSNRDT